MRKASSTGIRAAVFSSSVFWKIGLSLTVSRIHRPTAISSALSRNGIRQPHARNCSSVTEADTTANTVVPMTSPSGTPTCGQLP